MKTTILCFFIFVMAGSFETFAYTTKYDNIDLDYILNNERIYLKYFNCLVGNGKCTPDAKELKDTLPDALKTGCARCNEKQKAGVEKVLKFVIKNRPNDYKAVEAIYDPEGIFREKYKTLLQEKGIILPK